LSRYRPTSAVKTEGKNLVRKKNFNSKFCGIFIYKKMKFWGVRILLVIKSKYHFNLQYHKKKLRNKNYIKIKQTAEEIWGKK